jgi:hypothetical protein
MQHLCKPTRPVSRTAPLSCSDTLLCVNEEHVGKAGGKGSEEELLFGSHVGIRRPQHAACTACSKETSPKQQVHMICIHHSVEGVGEGFMKLHSSQTVIDLQVHHHDWRPWAQWPAHYGGPLLLQCAVSLILKSRTLPRELCSEHPHRDIVHRPAL